MKINLLYFSGTGNTKYIADYLEKNLKDTNNMIKSFDISQNPIIDKDIDLLIVGGPIYAGNVPEKLIRWILKNVPENSKAKCIVYSTSSGTINAFGVDSLAKKLNQKGYTILSKEIFTMPRNFYFGSYSMNTESEIKNLLLETNKKLDLLISEIKNNTFKNKNFENKKVPLRDFFAETFSIMARFMGKNFSVDDTCIKCGLCIKNCPQNNIILDKNNTIKFKNKCMMCTKCIHNCPKNSISYKGTKYEQYKINDVKKLIL